MGDHAPVVHCALSIEGDAIVGYAAPAAGRLPCLLRLVADGETIMLARATRFSREAERGGIRLGWCGAQIAGLHLAAALDDRVEVRCAASDRLLLHAPVPPGATAPPPRPPLTVFDLIAFARRDDICTDLPQIVPFAVASYRAHGIAGLLAATYRSCLRREPEAAIVAQWEATPPPSPVPAALMMVMQAAEYRDDPLRFIPGPFHPAFAFDLSPLDV